MPRATVAASFSLEAWSERASDDRTRRTIQLQQQPSQGRRLAVQHIFIERLRASGNDAPQRKRRWKSCATSCVSSIVCAVCCEGGL